jgi:hypothetical protein
MTTKFEIMAQTVAYVSGRPLAEVREILGRRLPARALAKLEAQSVSDAEADRLLAAFQAEAPGIRHWALGGGRRPRAGGRSDVERILDPSGT